jgi:uncharacterized protein YndB with AHSA1/START domain
MPMPKKIIKVAAIVIILIIAIPLITALFVKKEYTVERDVTINRPIHEVFDYVKYLKNQDNYSAWASLDPDMKQEFHGSDGTVGFRSAWEGNKDVGKGEQTIVNITEGERIDFALHFIEPWEGHADAYMTTTAVSEDQTTVTWGFKSSMPYPFNIMMLFMDMDELIGNDLETGLVRLKAILEKEGIE